MESSSQHEVTNAKNVASTSVTTTTNNTSVTSYKTAIAEEDLSNKNRNNNSSTFLDSQPKAQGKFLNEKLVFKTDTEEYEVNQIIGKGNFGTVYKAFRKSDGLECALKMVKISSMKEFDAAKTEFEIMKQFDHPHIVKTYDSFCIEVEQALHMSIVQEFCNMETLDHLLRSKPMARTIQNNIDFLIQWMLDLLDTLAYIHSKNIIHRDLKPGNIFLSLQMKKELDDSNTLLSFVTKIGDFGVSTENSRNAQLTTFSGTPLFMPKEMIQRESYTATVDVYAMGLIFVQMTLGISTEELAKKVGVFSKLSQEVRLEALEKVIKDPSVFYIISQMIKDKESRKPSNQLLQDPVIKALRYLQSLELPSSYNPTEQLLTDARKSADGILAFITGLHFQSIKTKISAIENIYYYLFDFENRSTTLQLFLKGKGYFYLVKAMDKILNFSDMSHPMIQSSIQQTMRIIHLCLSESTTHSLFASLRRSSIYSLLNRVYHCIDVTLCLEILVFLAEKTCTQTMSQLIFKQSKFLRMVETIIQEEPNNGSTAAQFSTAKGKAAQNWMAVMGKHAPLDQQANYMNGKISTPTMSRIFFSIPPPQRELVIISAIHFYLNRMSDLLKHSQNRDEEQVCLEIQNALHGLLCYVENHQTSLIRSSLFHTCETASWNTSNVAHDQQTIRYAHFFYKCYTCHTSSTHLICPTCSISCHKGHKLVPLGYLIDGICDCDERNTCICKKEISFMKSVKDESLFRYHSSFILERAIIQLRDLDNPIDLQLESDINGPIIKYSSNEKLVEYQLPASVLTLQPICVPNFDESQQLSPNSMMNQTWNQTISDLNTGETIAYFEVSIVCGGWIDAIGIGVTQDVKYPNTSFPGFKAHSIGFSGDDGNLVYHLHNSPHYVRMPYFQTFGSGDVIGCGVTQNGFVYYTINGRFISIVDQFRLQSNQPVYAIFGLKGNETEIRINFGRKQFLFNFLQLQQFLNEEDSSIIRGLPFAKEAFMASNGMDIVQQLATQFQDDPILIHLLLRVCECVQVDALHVQQQLKKVKYQNTKNVFLQTGALVEQPLSKLVVDKQVVMAVDSILPKTGPRLLRSSNHEEEQLITEAPQQSQQQQQQTPSPIIVTNRANQLGNILLAIPEIVLLVASIALLIAQCVLTWLDYNEISIDMFIFIAISLIALLVSIILDTIIVVSSTVRLKYSQTTLYSLPCTVLAFISLTLQQLFVPIHVVTCAVRYRALYYTIFRLEFFNSLNFGALLVWSLFFVKSCLQLLHVLNRINYFATKSKTAATKWQIATRLNSSTQVLIYFILCSALYLTRFIVIIASYIPPSETFDNLGRIFITLYSLNEYLVSRLPYGYLLVLVQTLFAWGYFFIYWGNNWCCCWTTFTPKQSICVLLCWNVYTWLYICFIGSVPFILFLNDVTVLMNRIDNQLFTVLVGYLFRILLGIFIFATPLIVSVVTCVGLCCLKRRSKKKLKQEKEKLNEIELDISHVITEEANHTVQLPPPPQQQQPFSLPAPGTPIPAVPVTPSQHPSNPFIQPPLPTFSPATPFTPLTQQLLQQDMELPSVYLVPHNVHNLTGFGQK